MAGGRPSEGRWVIVNADDFGLTVGVNAGIIGAHHRGPVRAASLMVTTPGFADAVALADTHPGLDLGIHLALTAVMPALPPHRIPSLVRANGRFPSLADWLRRAAAGRLRPDEVRAELDEQLRRALATGRRFSHLDSHHHVHLFAPVAPVVADLAREYAIPVVRRVRDPRPAPGRTRIIVSPKRLLLERADARWGPAYAGLARVDAFRGFAFPTHLDGWRALLRAVPTGVTELMCHPGLIDPAVGALDSYVEERVSELRWLTDRRVLDLFVAEGIAITSFAEMLAAGDGTR